MSPPDIDALVFDIQGTLLDFFTPVRRALSEALVARTVTADATALTNAWRRAYTTETGRVAAGERAFVPVAAIYREGLDAILGQAGLAETFTPSDRDALTRVWTHLVPWPDTVEGLHRLRRRLVLATLTNASMQATIGLAARHDLGFHAILSTELVRTFKPAPETYRLALDYLGHAPERVMMVASHPTDLQAARDAGMRTALIERPLEFGPDTPNQAAAPVGTDLVVADLLAFADRFGA